MKKKMDSKLAKRQVGARRAAAAAGWRGQGSRRRRALFAGTGITARLRARAGGVARRGPLRPVFITRSSTP